MAVGPSGRVVVDIDPEIKRRLHSALAAEGRTLKEWFVDMCEAYLESRSQGLLFPARGDSAASTLEEERRR